MCIYIYIHRVVNDLTTRMFIRNKIQPTPSIFHNITTTIQIRKEIQKYTKYRKYTKWLVWNITLPYFNTPGPTNHLLTLFYRKWTHQTHCFYFLQRFLLWKDTRDLVKISTIWLTKSILTRLIISFLIFSLIKWTPISKCLVLSWKIGFKIVL